MVSTFPSPSDQTPTEPGADAARSQLRCTRQSPGRTGVAMKPTPAPRKAPASSRRSNSGPLLVAAVMRRGGAWKLTVTSPVVARPTLQRR